jgi:hypothetical protein
MRHPRFRLADRDVSCWDEHDGYTPSRNKAPRAAGAGLRATPRFVNRRRLTAYRAISGRHREHDPVEKQTPLRRLERMRNHESWTRRVRLRGSPRAPLTRRYRRDLRVEGMHAGVSVGNDMPPDPLALRGYDEFGVTWPVPEQTVWGVLVQQVT